ncbi:MAG: sigma-54 dependent transcriptional regulator [Bacteroidales bacterium]|jgi:two-component system nitrogen regulation response regulator NtrX|nr:sigma-54 dependent transcriptional regulator [Bacteroidales bacterium]MDD2687188.1 sigma-54 dependent transcriptional regulator [Bacteroidales bacterium]MDD3329932.1 sigma-54 dependent transcriptional regulator [Bacteroidales bacterium]MDD3691643.1 sigma-54 dependent transcriptional regulator [Bacteroidales bacterium]MDD4044160.1 sigma-54 dependent transcriptional regulator [Bacteroidales bacterium]
MDSQKILIIDDEAPIRHALRDILEYENYHIEEASNATEALSMLNKEKFNTIISDIKMPNMDGIELLEKVKEICETPVIMITGHGDIETAVETIKKGAFDYITKPLDLNRLLVSVRNAQDKQHLINETKKLKKKISKRFDIIGESPAIRQLKDIIEKVAPTNARVLITGENGTGKELVAHWLHEKSDRSSQAFIEVNCAAIPSELIESELFGHEKGSFTSAVKQRKGNFELADNGTLFLDEIGDMSLSAQAKVLRALQENKITRVGGEKDIHVNVRVIAATNKNLHYEIENRTFREDLYHRINVINLHVPPLRERLDDIPLLVEHFTHIISENQGMPLRTFNKDAYEVLKKLPWKGNIRELHNIVERLMILCDNPITGADVTKYTRHS